MHFCLAHPILTPLSAPWMPSPLTAHTPTPLIPNSPTITDPPAESGSWNGDNAAESVSWDQDDNGWEQEEFTFPLSCSPSPFAPNDHSNENIQFFGLGDKFYRHYHPKFTGKLIFAVVFAFT